MDLAPNDMLIEIDGPGIEPATVDGRLLVLMAAAYIKLVDRCADALDGELTYTNPRVINKCAAYAWTVNDPPLAWRANRAARQCLSGVGVNLSHGMRADAEEVRSLVHQLGSNSRALARVGGRKIRIVDDTPAAVEGMPWEETTLWARVLMVGGRKRDHVLLQGDSEPDPFSLDVDTDTAKLLGPHLKSDIIATVEIARDADGRIEAGKLLSFELPDVPEGKDLEAWRDWFERVVDVDATKENLAHRGDD